MIYQHWWQRQKQHWSRRVQRKEMLPTTLPCHMPIWKLLTGVLVQKVHETLLRRMYYQMSRKDAGKTPQDQTNNLWLTNRFWSTVKNTSVVSQCDGLNFNVVNLFENNKETWGTELTACNESIGEVDIRRGFQCDFLSPLIFVAVLISLSMRIFCDDVGMAFGLYKCVLLVLKRGKMNRGYY